MTDAVSPTTFLREARYAHWVTIFPRAEGVRLDCARCGALLYLAPEVGALPLHAFLERARTFLGEHRDCSARRAG